MNPVTYIFGIVTAVLILFVVIELLRRGRLRERHAVWWLFAGILGLIIGIFPDVLGWVSELLGVEVPINLAFFVSIAILFLAYLQQSTEVTELEARSRTLIESHALLELRVRELENQGELRTGDDQDSPD